MRFAKLCGIGGKETGGFWGIGGKKNLKRWRKNRKTERQNERGGGKEWEGGKREEEGERVRARKNEDVKE